MGNVFLLAETASPRISGTFVFLGWGLTERGQSAISRVNCRKAKVVSQSENEKMKAKKAEKKNSQNVQDFRNKCEYSLRE